VLLEGSRLIVA